MIDEPKSEMSVEDVLNCEVSDDALERAADNARIFTVAFCTQEWNYCYPL